ncbi:MAG: thioredoxin family protein [Planctomycetota bacterium]
MRTSLKLAAATLAVLAGGLLGPSVFADDSEGEKKPIAKTGEKAPDFTLKDLEGKEVSLAKVLEQKKIVVLEWFNPECPVVKGHYEKNTMTELQKKYKDKVVWLAINSGAKGKQGHGIEKNKAAAEKWKISWPILFDESGAVGRLYAAKTTPHMFVIDAKGVLAYQGAIDSAGGKRGKRGGNKEVVNYVDRALTALLAGEKVEVTDTKPYGCSVKYGVQE